MVKPLMEKAETLED